MLSQEKLRFGKFQFHLGKACLVSPDGEIPLNPKSAAVLAYLVQRPGQIIPKEELLKAVWGDISVTDDAIVQRVLDIRKALGDNSKTPQFIRTHTKRGYEFVGAVSALPELAEKTSAPQLSRHFSAVLLMLVVAGGFFIWWIAKSHDGSQQPDARITQVTFLPGMEDYAVFDPAGKRILYSSDESGNANLWIYDRETGERYQITRSPTNLSEADWSPTSEWVAYRSEENPSGLHARSLVTGETIRIAEFGHHPRWSPDGTQVAFHGSGGSGDIMVWNKAERSIRKIGITDPPLINRSYPVWSRNGKWLFFLASIGSDSKTWGDAESRDWVHLGHQIWRVAVDGGKARVVTPRTGILRDGGFDLDAVRSQLVFVGLDRSLWRSKINQESGQETVKPTRLTLTTQAHQHPRFNEQGEIIFSGISAPESLWMIPFSDNGKLDESRMERITTGAASARGPALSPDQRRIAYFIWQGERFELWILDLQTRKVQAIGPSDRLSRTSPVWSQDGRWLGYTVLAGRNREARVAAFNPDFTHLTRERSVTNVPLLRQGFVMEEGIPKNLPTPILFDPTRKYRVSLRLENRLQTMWVESASGKSIPLTTPGHYLHPSWAADTRRIFFQSDADGWFNLWSIGFDPVSGSLTHSPRQISSFRGSPYLLSDSNLGYAVLKQGIVLPLRENRSDLWLIRPHPLSD